MLLHYWWNHDGCHFVHDSDVSIRNLEDIPKVSLLIILGTFLANALEAGCIDMVLLIACKLQGLDDDFPEFNTGFKSREGSLDPMVLLNRSVMNIFILGCGRSISLAILLFNTLHVPSGRSA